MVQSSRLKDGITVAILAGIILGLAWFLRPVTIKNSTIPQRTELRSYILQYHAKHAEWPADPSDLSRDSEDAAKLIKENEISWQVVERTPSVLHLQVTVHGRTSPFRATIPEPTAANP